jgi:hypothetical protein
LVCGAVQGRSELIDIGDSTTSGAPPMDTSQRGSSFASQQGNTAAPLARISGRLSTSLSTRSTNGTLVSRSGSLVSIRSQRTSYAPQWGSKVLRLRQKLPAGPLRRSTASTAGPIRVHCLAAIFCSTGVAIPTMLVAEHLVSRSWRSSTGSDRALHRFCRSLERGERAAVSCIWLSPCPEIPPLVQVPTVKREPRCRCSGQSVLVA